MSRAIRQSARYADEVNPRLYNMAIGAVLLWGFAINWLMVTHIPVASVAGINPILFFVCYFVSCLFGAFLYNSSSDPLVSFIGYNFVVIPFGFVLNLIVSRYDHQIVADALQVTGLVTLIMMALGSLFPAFFEKIAGALLLALLATVLVEMVEIVIFRMHQGILNWIVALIFCGYIGFDWAMANSMPRTLDNAVDSAANLYMDIINLFVRILSIMGDRDGD